MMTKIKHRLAQFLRNRHGGATVEVALALPVLILLALGAVTWGDTIIRNTQLANAVRSGAQYAVVRKPVGGDVSDIIAAVNNTAPVDKTGTRTVSVNLFCRCPDGTSVDCTGACASGDDRQAYISVTLNEQYPRIVPLPGTARRVDLTQEATVRLN